MRSDTIVLSLLSSSLLTTPILATICWANGFRNGIDGVIYNVGYIDGALAGDLSNPPDMALITPQGTNPCGTPFNIDNSGSHSGYTLNGCGGNSMWLDQNGAFHADCTARPKEIAIGGTFAGGQGFFIGHVEQQFCC